MGRPSRLVFWVLVGAALLSAAGFLATSELVPGLRTFGYISVDSPIHSVHEVRPLQQVVVSFSLRNRTLRPLRVVGATDR